MRRTETKVIDGLCYEVTTVGAVEGRRLTIKLTHLIAPLLTGGKPILDKVRSTADSEAAILAAILDSEELFSLLRDYFMELDEAELEPFWQAFTASTRVVNTSASTSEALSNIFDEHFAGDGQFAMWSFFFFAMKVNFSGFLGRLLPAKAEGATPSR